MEAEVGEEEVAEGDGVALVEEVEEVEEVTVEGALMEVVEVTVEVGAMAEEGGRLEEAEEGVSTTRGQARDISRGTTGTSTTSTDRITIMITVEVEVRDISIRPCWRILGPSLRSITGMEVELEGEMEVVEGTL